MGKIWLWRLVAFLIFVGSLVGVEQAFATERRYLIELESGRETSLSTEVSENIEFVSQFEWKGRKFLSVNMDEASLESVSSAPGVVSVELDPKRFLIRPQPSEKKSFSETMVQSIRKAVSESGVKGVSKVSLWGLDRVRAKEVSSEKAENRKICIIDSGYNSKHDSLYENSVSYSFAGGWGDPTRDRCEHGTHVAGTIVARKQINGMEGIVADKELPLHIVKVFNDSCGWSFASDLMKGIKECQEAGAHVVNMSLGGPTRSNAEERFFQEVYDSGLLLVAAAGNEGTSQLSFPASYASVVSVAAIDENDQLASFSQRNSRVELSAPGVGIWSAVNSYVQAEIKLDSERWPDLNGMEGASEGVVSASLVNGDKCLEKSDLWKNRIVLCERGDATFFEKTQAALNSGALAVVIYNNQSGDFRGTLGANKKISIPVLSIDRLGGLELKSVAVGKEIELTHLRFEDPSSYASLDGTSMATPHVSGVAALVWSHNPEWTAVQVREALCAGAEPLVDSIGSILPHTGCGVVQADRALEWLRTRLE